MTSTPQSPTGSTKQSEISSHVSLLEILTDYFTEIFDRRSIGRAIAIRFMRAFAGTILAIPNSKVIEKIARDQQITDVLKRDPSTAAVRRLSEIHGMPMRAIAKTFNKKTGHGLKRLRANIASIANTGVICSASPTVLKIKTLSTLPA